MFNRKARAKNKLLKDLAMFASFMGISCCVYFFTCSRNEPSVRGYLTAFSLLLAYCFQFQTYDERMRTIWACFFAWTVSSNVYYDVRTHLYGYYRLARHIVFVFFALAAASKKLKPNNRLRVCFWIIVAFGPDISSNVYGNALFSILRIFALHCAYNDTAGETASCRRVCLGVLLPRSSPCRCGRSNLVRLLAH